VKGWKIFSDAAVRVSGLAGRARFSMSRASGKVEILGVDSGKIYLRYHRSKYAENREKFFACERDDNAYWLEQLRPVVRSFVPKHVHFAGSELQTHANAYQRNARDVPGLTVAVVSLKRGGVLGQSSTRKSTSINSQASWNTAWEAGI